MMLPYDINNNILISGTYSSGGYQDKYENWDICKEKKIWGWNQNQKNSWTCVTHNSSNNWHMKKSHWYIIEGCPVVLLFLFHYSKNWLIYLHCKLGVFLSFLWCLRVTMCIVPSGTSHLHNIVSEQYVCLRFNRLGRHHGLLGMAMQPATYWTVIGHDFQRLACLPQADPVPSNAAEAEVPRYIHNHATQVYQWRQMVNG